MTEADGTRYKVGRVLDQYGRRTLAERLPALWTGEAGERHSLRDLADRVNRRLLESAMVEAGMDPLDGEVDNVYRLLTDDAASSGARTRARRRLEREGVDVGALTDDFVTHQAIHTYLREHHGAERDETERDETETIERLRSRARAVTENTVERLRERDELRMGDPAVVVDVQVVCGDCGAQYAATDLIERGGCHCEES